MRNPKDFIAREAKRSLAPGRSRHVRGIPEQKLSSQGPLMLMPTLRAREVAFEWGFGGL